VQGRSFASITQIMNSITLLLFHHNNLCKFWNSLYILCLVCFCKNIYYTTLFNREGSGIFTPFAFLVYAELFGKGEGKEREVRKRRERERKKGERKKGERKKGERKWGEKVGRESGERMGREKKEGK
jgi:hypothetical protein